MSTSVMAKYNKWAERYRTSSPDQAWRPEPKSAPYTVALIALRVEEDQEFTFKSGEETGSLPSVVVQATWQLVNDPGGDRSFPGKFWNFPDIDADAISKVNLPDRIELPAVGAWQIFETAYLKAAGNP